MTFLDLCNNGMTMLQLGLTQATPYLKPMCQKGRIFGGGGGGGQTCAVVANAGRKGQEG